MTGTTIRGRIIGHSTRNISFDYLVDSGKCKHSWVKADLLEAVECQRCGIKMHPFTVECPSCKNWFSQVLQECPKCRHGNVQNHDIGYEVEEAS